MEQTEAIRIKGFPIILSAPSGGGKSTIAEEVIKRSNQSIVRSISCTTRPARQNERNGVDYFFLKEEEFKEKVDKKEFLEWAVVHDHYYGTPKQNMEMQLDTGKDVMLVIDPQGAAAVRKIYPNGIYIFVVPPTWDALKARLKGRGTDDEAAMEIRYADARIELRSLKHYEFLVLNDELEKAVSDVLSILRSEHCRLSRINKKSIPILGG